MKPVRRKVPGMGGRFVRNPRGGFPENIAKKSTYFVGGAKLSRQSMDRFKLAWEGPIRRGQPIELNGRRYHFAGGGLLDATENKPRIHEAYVMDSRRNLYLIHFKNGMMYKMDYKKLK